MSTQDDDKSIVNFDALEADEGDKGTPDEEQKLKAVLTFLKTKLEGEDYAKVLEGLGVKDEMSNAELYEAMKALLKGEDKEKDDDDDDDDKEKDAADFKDFMKKCMEGGKDLKECREEYKEKYPEPEKEPKEEEISEVEELAKTMLAAKKAEEENPTDKLLKDALARIKVLEDKDLNAGATAKVDALIQDKHVAPVQKEGILKLAARLDDEGKEELFEFFEKTQKFSAHQDVGQLESGKPGSAGGGIEISPERKAELIELHGLGGLIEEKADMDKLPWRKRDN